MKKILSLVLVFILALGCLGMSASALGNPVNTPNTINNVVYPSIKGIEFIVGNNTYPGELVVDTTLHTASYVAYFPEAATALTSVSVKVYSNYDGTEAALKISGNVGNPVEIDEDDDYTWSGININYLSDFYIDGELYAFNPVYGCDLRVTSVTIGGLTDYNPTYSLVGSVPRFSARVNITNGSLTNLAVSAIPAAANGVSCLIDGHSFTSTDTFDFSSGSHVLTITCTVNNVAYSRDYRLYANQNTITVYVGVRTWTVYDWNNSDVVLFNYADPNYAMYGIYPGDDNVEDLDAAAAYIDTSYTTDGDWIPSFINNRPIFAEDNYIEVDLTLDQSGHGISAMDALYEYIASDDLDSVLSASGSSTYLEAINEFEEFYCGNASGWMYLVRNANNDVTTAMPNVSAADYDLYDGAFVDWIYTCAYGMDFGYSMFDLE